MKQKRNVHFAAQSTAVPFALRTNFIDPVYDVDGTLYAPKRYNEIIKEKYFLSKHAHIGYGDIDMMTPTERQLVAQFIINDLKQEKEALDNINNKHKLT